MITRISLEELVQKYWKTDCGLLPDITSTMDKIRMREHWFHKLLPAMIVRRLDAGFARSNTVHPDTGRALYAICRATKPKCIFETGTYWGYSTAYLAAGLRDNGSGEIHTFDIYKHAGKHIPASLRRYVTLYRGRPATSVMPEMIGKFCPALFFQDSLHDYEGVAGELAIALPHMKPGGVFLIHDFVDLSVRKAVVDVLKACAIYVLEGQDAQQLGVAVIPFE